MADRIVNEDKPTAQAAAPVAKEHHREVATARFSMGKTFAALEYPNYRLWFYGQLASLVGTWMQSAAQQFLIYQLTGNNPAYLGYVGFASGLPTWLFMPYAGVVADRMSRRTLMLITQSVMLVLAFILAALTFMGMVQPWHIIVLAFLLGIANSFDAPARQAFVLEMVDRKDMTNAIALNSTMFQAATIFGPAFAGITYSLLGPAWCFTINGISFIAVIAALAAMKLKPVEIRKRATSGLQDLMEGLRYTIRHPMIRTLIAIVGVSSLFGLAFATLFPDWAVTVLHGDAATNGYLQSARGLGAMISALMIASLGRFRGKGKLLTVGMFIFPITLVLFALTNTIWLSLLMLVAAGWAFMLMMNMANTLVQIEVTDELRGRVMALYSLVFFGFMPIGALGAGVTAGIIGAPITVGIGGIAMLVIAIAVFIFFPKIRAEE
ncbi:MAG: MFS transporter [Anaerolineae bacterium]